MSPSEKKRRKKEHQQIDDIFNSVYPYEEITPLFKHTSLNKFLDHLGYDEVEEAACISFSQMKNSTEGIKYFCGICWNKIKHNQI